jgi:alanine racemase
VCIPYSRSGHYKESATINTNIIAIPQGIFPFKNAIIDSNIVAFLQGGLAIRENGISDHEILSLEKCSFSGKHLLVDRLHNTVSNRSVLASNIS